MQTTRRDFLKRAAFIAAVPAVLRPNPTEPRLPIAFSTLGCPAWDWNRILERAHAWGFAAIELRGVNGEMDLTRVHEFAPTRVADTLRRLKDYNLKICNLGSSCQMHEKDPAARAAQFDEALRFIDLAQKLEAPYVRVFGNKFVEGESRKATIDRIIAGLKQLGRHARGTEVGILLETHGDFASSELIAQIMAAVDMPEIALLWDTRHTFVAGGEVPSDTWKAIGRWIRHTHIKDSVQKPKERYVLLGKGDVPVSEIIRVLREGEYRGYYCFEWEKKWHPEIEEPEVAIPHFSGSMREYLKP
jgi:sugar phosphate isomerase/epimerase